jgi:hypothetical protein
MGAPTGLVGLQHETREKAADAHTTASSIWYNFQLFRVVPADLPTQQHPHSGFCHAATKIAAGAPIAGIRSQAKRTTVKLESLKFTNKNDKINK